MREVQARAVVLPDGSIAHFEVVQGSGGGDYTDAAAGPLSFSGVLDAIEGVASALGQTMKKLGPRSASVEMGVELSTKEGKLLALFVQGEGKANLKLKLEWGASSQP